MGRKKENMRKDVEGREDKGIWICEVSLTGRVDTIEKFKGYVKVKSRDTGWIYRFPPGTTVIKPYSKQQAEKLWKVYREIEKEKQGKILQQNWEILKKFGYDREEIIIRKKKHAEKTKQGIRDKQYQKKIQEIKDMIRDMDISEKLQILSEIYKDKEVREITED